jgi:hypothetical protein
VKRGKYQKLDMLMMSSHQRQKTKVFQKDLTFLLKLANLSLSTLYEANWRGKSHLLHVPQTSHSAAALLLGKCTQLLFHKLSEFECKCTCTFLNVSLFSISKLNGNQKPVK